MFPVKFDGTWNNDGSCTGDSDADTLSDRNTDTHFHGHSRSDGYADDRAFATPVLPIPCYRSRRIRLADPADQHSAGSGLPESLGAGDDIINSDLDVVSHMISMAALMPFSTPDSILFDRSSTCWRKCLGILERYKKRNSRIPLKLRSINQTRR